MNPFGSLPLAEIRSLAAPVLDLQMPAGTVLLEEGVVAGTFFVIRTGTALLAADGSPVSTLGPGDCFGELDPARASVQPYGVITASPLRALAFSSFGIARLCDAIPGVRGRLQAGLPRLAAVEPVPVVPVPAAVPVA